MASVSRVPAGWRARYRTPEGASRSRTFERKAQAERFLTSVEHSKLSGAYIERSQTTFTETAQRWLGSNPTKRATTYARDAMVIRVHLDPVIGRVKLSDLTPTHCRSVVTVMAGKGLAPKTIKTNAGVLRAILGWAVEGDLLARSPYRGVKLPAVTPRKARTADADDVLRLVEAMPVDYRVAVLLGALGLRLAEVTGLRVASIDFLRKTVTIDATLNEVEGRWVAGDGKTTASRRTIAVPESVVLELAAHVARTGRTGAELLLQAPGGGPVRPTNFRTRIYNPALVRAGLVGLNFHRLRHSAGHLMREAGAPLEAIQKRLGHASIRTTADVYGSLPEPVDRRIATELDRLFSTPRVTSVSQRPES